jgi:hypothetical protein
MLFIYSLISCEGSSSTRSAAKDATSGDYQINAQILVPADGATVVFISGSSNVTFSASATGGTGTYGFTWTVQGPTTVASASGANPTIIFQEVGAHKVSVTVEDSNGIIGTDSVNITVTTGGSGVTTPTTTTTTTTTSTTTTTITTTTTTT